MVNKAALLVIGGAAVTLLLVGALVGAALGGGGGGSADADRGPTTVPPTPLPPLNATETATPTATPSATPTPTAASTPTATPTPTSTPTPTATSTSTPTATPAPTPTPTATPTPTPTEPERQSVPPSHFDEAEIERLIAQFVNDRREAADLTRLDATGETARRLHEMALDHSVAMAHEGAAVHEIDGQTSADRYEANDLYRSCRYSSSEGELVTPDNADFEAIWRTIAGEEYQQGSQTKFNGNETAVARTIVEAWWSSHYRDRLALPGVEQIGVGVGITEDGEVYATANLCRF